MKWYHEYTLDGIYFMLHISSDQHNSVALFKVDSFKDPSLPNVHCEWCRKYNLKICQQKISLFCMVPVLLIVWIVSCEDPRLLIHFFLLPFFEYSCNFQGCDSEQVQSSGTPQCFWKTDKVRKWVRESVLDTHSHVSNSTSIWYAHLLLPVLYLSDLHAVVENSHLMTKYWSASLK